VSATQLSLFSAIDLIDRLIDILIDCLLACLIACLLNLLIYQLIDCLVLPSFVSQVDVSTAIGAAQRQVPKVSMSIFHPFAPLCTLAVE
jgi:hypothetical protein